MAEELSTTSECYNAFANVLMIITENIEKISERCSKKGLKAINSDIAKISRVVIQKSSEDFREKILKNFIRTSSTHWNKIFQRNSDFFLMDDTMFTEVGEGYSKAISQLREIWRVSEAMSDAEKEGFFRNAISLTNIAKRYARLNKANAELILQNYGENPKAFKKEDIEKVRGFYTELIEIHPLWEDYVSHDKKVGN